MKTLITLFLLCTSLTFAHTTPLRKHDKFIIYAIPKCGTHLIEHTIKLLTKQNIREYGQYPFCEQLTKAENRNAILRIWPSYDERGLFFLYKSGYKLVTMIRDPRDALISLLFYMRSYEGTLSRRDFFSVEENFDQFSLDEQLHSLMNPKTSASNYLDFYKERIGWAYPSYFLTVNMKI